MLLALDIGNSTINMGLFHGLSLRARLKMSVSPRGSPGRYGSEIEAFLDREGVETPLEGAIISSVVPELEGLLLSGLRKLTSEAPLVVSSSLNTGLSFGVERPDEIGSDRIANAVAAIEMAGDPVLVADFGTATTITVVKESDFRGGAILPGLGLMAEGLHKGTSKLPLVEIDREIRDSRPFPAPVGKDTKKSIVSGIIYGTAGGVERLIGEIEKEEGCAYKVILTGGYADTLARFFLRECRLEPDLTLRGLRLLYERNS